MELDNTEWQTINKALDTWETDGRLSKAKAEELRQTLTQKKAGQQIAQYFFLIALSCTMMAFSAIFIDEKLLERVKIYFSLSNIFVAGIMAVLAVAWFIYIRKKSDRIKNIAFEVYTVLGGLASITALVYICKDLGFGDSYSGFLFAAFILLVSLSIFFKSRALWIGSLAALLGWYGSFTYIYSANHSFLGMNYPVRFTIFGMFLIGFSMLQHRLLRLDYSQRVTYLAGLIIFFVGLWGVSVFGNYSNFEAWLQVRQTQVLAYSIVFGAAAFIAFYLGIKYRDDIARDLGILFLLLNFYSRYFEFFWDSMHKGVFFLVLAVSFWFIGRWIEKKRKKAEQ